MEYFVFEYNQVFAIVLNWPCVLPNITFTAKELFYKDFYSFFLIFNYLSDTRNFNHAVMVNYDNTM